MPTYYRYHESLWSDSRVMLILFEYQVVKTTPAGVWLDDGFGLKRFVLSGARKRWACPTKTEALVSFHARKNRQARILRAQLNIAEAALQLQQEGDTVAY